MNIRRRFNNSISRLRPSQIAVACLGCFAITSCSMVRIEQDGRVLSHSIHVLSSPILPRPEQGLAVYRTTAFGVFRSASILGVGAATDMLAFAATADACGTIMLVESLPTTLPSWLLDAPRKSPQLLCVAELSPKEKTHDQ
jgi:hypothetical protein